MSTIDEARRGTAAMDGLITTVRDLDEAIDKARREVCTFEHEGDRGVWMPMDLWEAILGAWRDI